MKEQQQRFLDAVNSGDLEQVTELLKGCQNDEEKSSLLTSGIFGTPLYIATQAKNNKMIDLIIDSCPNDETRKTVIFQDSAGGGPALMVASDVNYPYAINKMMQSCKDDADRKALLNERNRRYTTALYEACEKGHSEAVLAILGNCPKDYLTEFLSIRYNGGDTVLHRAAITGDQNIIKAILDFCPNNVKNKLITATNTSGENAFKLYLGDDQEIKDLLNPNKQQRVQPTRRNTQPANAHTATALTQQAPVSPSSNPQASQNTVQHNPNPLSQQQTKNPYPAAKPQSNHNNVWQPPVQVVRQVPQPPVGNSKSINLAIGAACFVAVCAITLYFKPDLMKSAFSNAKDFASKYIGDGIKNTVGQIR